ncbi:hypothetical protein DVS77_21495 [Mycolicibacterium moriokaense]|nr:hypothetical protein DVS77_21495 [Mycolicibacterium moriokaense]
MNHATKRFPQFVFGLIIFVIVLNILGSAISPYLGLIGIILAIMLGAIIIAGGAFVLYLLARGYMNSRSGDDDDDLILGNWD